MRTLLRPEGRARVRVIRGAVVAVLLLLTFGQSALGQVQYASLGPCSLELGGIVEDCRLAYITFGTLDEDRRNAILIPTWFSGRAENWRAHLGPEGMVDTTTAYVIVVESFGSGESSSPSTSETQPGSNFPEITIGDMVDISYRLATEQLGLPELRAVVGFSLGGLQALEWTVRHPEFVDRVVSLAGNAEQGLYQRILWDLLAYAAEEGATGEMSKDHTASLLGRLGALMLTSPEALNRRPRDQHDDYLARRANQMRSVDLWAFAWQARAISRHDLARDFNGDLSRAGSRWRGQALVVAASNDHSISSESAQEYAQVVGAEFISLSSPQGHSAVLGDSDVRARVRAFLRR